MLHPLVTTAWLADHLHDADVRILDIRGHVLPADAPLPHYYAHRAEYDAAHIPNALFVDWTQDIVEPNSLSQDIADPERFAALMGRLGVGDDTLVVAYDDADSMFAARLWWALRYYGHERVVVLDGGWQKWVTEALPVTAEVVMPAPAVFTPRPVPSLRKTADDVARLGKGALVDVRTPQEFVGEISRARRRGHIPNALNLPRGVLVAEGGLMPAPDVLRARFLEAGVQLDAPEVVFYCNAGVSASYGLLAWHVAGFAQGSVYDGSWKDWGNDENKPIIT